MQRFLRPLLSCFLVSCATARTTGSFVERPAPNAMHALAVDAGRQLGLLYPPTHTQLSFTHPTDDEFGRSLGTELRSHGFAVAEQPSRGSQLALGYVVDAIADLYRVLLHVRTAERRITLARMYTCRGEAVRAAGAWTQQVAP